MQIVSFTESVWTWRFLSEFLPIFLPKGIYNINLEELGMNVYYKIYKKLHTNFNETSKQNINCSKHFICKQVHLGGGAER